MREFSPGDIVELIPDKVEKYDFISDARKDLLEMSTMPELTVSRRQSSGVTIKECRYTWSWPSDIFRLRIFDDFEEPSDDEFFGLLT